MFVFYTDGVTEATDPDGVLYGDDRLLQTLQRVDHSADVSTVTDLLMGDIRVFERGAPQADDITCVVLNYLGNCCVTDFLPAEPSSTGTH
jgi:sigma-B regulation protein RsbU (phosphoserine phosphatase)